MEQRLKKQRRRLMLRITLILLGVWAAVSATYCVIRLHNEKNELLSGTLAELARAKQLLSVSQIGSEDASKVYICDFNLLYFKELSEDSFDTQLLIIDPDSGKTIGNTAGKLKVKFSLGTEAGNYPDEEGFVSYDTVRSLLSESTYQRIVSLLTASRSDGKTNELACTRF